LCEKHPSGLTGRARKSTGLYDGTRKQSKKNQQKILPTLSSNHHHCRKEDWLRSDSTLNIKTERTNTPLKPNTPLKQKQK
jgi:hypothetical protein